MVGAVVAAVIIAAVVFVATRSDKPDAATTSTTTIATTNIETAAGATTRTQNTSDSPATTQASDRVPAASVTGTPLETAAATTPDSTRANGGVVTNPAAIDAGAGSPAIDVALLDPTFMQGGPWNKTDVAFQLSQDTCGDRRPLDGLVARKQQAFSSPLEGSGGQTEFINQEIDVFETTAQATAVVDAAITATANCTTTVSTDGRNLAVQYTMLPPNSGLGGCDQSFAFEEIESNATITLNFDYVVMRCANNIGWMRYSVGGTRIDRPSRLAALGAIFATSSSGIQAMPTRP